jgi:hypothetical protein
VIGTYFAWWRVSCEVEVVGLIPSAHVATHFAWKMSWLATSTEIGGRWGLSPNKKNSFCYFKLIFLCFLENIFIGGFITLTASENRFPVAVFSYLHVEKVFLLTPVFAVVKNASVNRFTTTSIELLCTTVPPISDLCGCAVWWAGAWAWSPGWQVDPHDGIMEAKVSACCAAGQKGPTCRCKTPAGPANIILLMHNQELPW